MPHLHLIATLLSIVANVEEQKRLARQSEVFLSMAQNVFSSLRKDFFFVFKIIIVKLDLRTSGSHESGRNLQ